MFDGWRLVHAEPLAMMYPERFDLNPLAPYLMPGDLCKIGIQPDTCDVLRAPFAGERFWVRVTERTESGYVGQLTQSLVLMALPAGSCVRFTAQHVIDVAED